MAPKLIGAERIRGFSACQLGDHEDGADRRTAVDLIPGFGGEEGHAGERATERRG